MHEVHHIGHFESANVGEKSLAVMRFLLIAFVEMRVLFSYPVGFCAAFVLIISVRALFVPEFQRTDMRRGLEYTVEVRYAVEPHR